MLQDKDLVKVTNRGTGRVGYKVQDLNIRRIYEPKETKEVTMEELRKLSYSIGGSALIRDNLIIRDEEAVRELIPDVEPEYYYEEEDVKNLLTKGSLDELLDCLDFAPEGTLNLVKKVAVEIELNDVQKRQAIFNALGFNVTNAIENSRMDEDEIQEEQKVRRATSKDSTSTIPGRRTAVITSIPKSNYKIVNKK